MERLDKFEHMVEQHEEQNQTIVDDELKLAVLLRAVWICWCCVQLSVHVSAVSWGGLAYPGPKDHP